MMPPIAYRMKFRPKINGSPAFPPITLTMPFCMNHNEFLSSEEDYFGRIKQPLERHGIS